MTFNLTFPNKSSSSLFFNTPVMGNSQPALFSLLLIKSLSPEVYFLFHFWSLRFPEFSLTTALSAHLGGSHQRACQALLKLLPPLLSVILLCLVTRGSPDKLILAKIYLIKMLFQVTWFFNPTKIR